LDKKEDDEMREESKNYILKEFMAEETGVGVIELVLILVILIGLAIVFKKQINTLLENIFKQINTKTKEVY
jgi:Flp pilus assembly pilin Flp